jgi:hypothetical protein
MFTATIDRPAGLTDDQWDKAALSAYDTLLAETPVATGNLLNSWSSPRVSDSTMTVTNSADYAEFVFEGTSRMAPRDAPGAAQMSIQSFLAEHGIF